MVGEFFDVRHRADKIEVFGDLRLGSLMRLYSAIHNAIIRQGYNDIEFDFRSLASLMPSVVPPLAAYLRHLTREYKADFSFVPPSQATLAQKMTKLGLSHYIDHRKFEKPKSNSSDPSLLQFMDHDTREVAVDKVLNAALRTTNLQRQHVAALEWAVNEITDNVLTHAESGVGGFLICYKLPTQNILEFAVADAGIGIGRSLKIADDVEAVEKAIQEGVTRNKTTNQGNGLFGTYRLASVSKSVFVLKSGYGNLYVNKIGETHVHRDPVPYKGTFVVCQIDCDDPDLLDSAFRFGGKSHVPAFDYIEKKHDEENNLLEVKASDICKTFGSRQSGQEARRYIKNLLGSNLNGKIKLDFDGIYVVSSSYADEVFGKLFVEMGPMQYMKRIELSNLDGNVSALIDRAITLRTQSGL